MHTRQKDLAINVSSLVIFFTKKRKKQFFLLSSCSFHCICIPEMGNTADIFYFCEVKKGIFVFFCLALLSCAATPDENASSGHVVLSKNLSHPNVRCFLEDNKGRMWIGTERGLNRYNGYDFRQYFHDDTPTSIPDNRIYDICMDDKNQIWVATEGGVAKYTDEDCFERIPIISDEKAVHQVLCDKKGRIILNMLEDLCVYDSLSCSFVSTVTGFDRFFSYHSRCYFDEEGLLWVVSPLEIRCFDTDGFENVDNFPMLHGVTESALLSDGQIWMAGRQRMSVFNTRTRSFKKMSPTLVQGLPKREIQMIAQLDSASVLFKTSDGGFYLYDRQEDALQTVSSEQLGLQPGFEVSTYYCDSRGDLWLGSDDHGFASISFPSKAVRSGGFTRRILDGKSVVSISPDPDGILWISTLHNGLFWYDPINNTLQEAPISDATVEDRTDFLQTNLPLIQTGSNGNLWVAFPNEQQIFQCLYKNGRLHLKKSHPAFYPRVSLKDNEGGVWFGTRNEYLAKMTPRQSELELIQIFPYKTTFINCLLLLDKEILIGAYDEPLTLLDIHTLQTRPLDIASRDSSPAFFYPTDFLLDREGNIWVGTRSNGLLKYDRNHKSLTSIPGSPCEDISAIEEDDFGHIWVSTPNGLAWYNPSENKFYDFFTSQGTADAFFYERSSASLPNGILAFGGSQGLTLVSPSEAPNQAPIPLVFEEIKVHDRAVLPGEGVVNLSHLDNSFGISFASPDYRNLHQVRYKYKLEGYNQDWVDIGPSREVYFANVPAGNYTFRVRHNLLQDESDYLENSLRINVHPSPWLSPLAKVLYAILFLLLALYLWQLRRRFLREREAVREARQEKEREQRTNRMNMAFFSNISHEFRTPLTMISGPVSELASSERLNVEEKNLLSIVQHSVRRMLALVNQVMDLSRLENASLRLKVREMDIVPVLERCLELFRLNASSMGLCLENFGMETPLVGWIDEDKIDKIVSNLLSNAVKFTPRGGKVSLRADQMKKEGVNYLMLSVADTGPGIPEDQREKIFDRFYQLDEHQKGRVSYGTGIGLFYARSLATIHHGILSVTNQTEGPGSVFTLSIPIDECAYPESERILSESPVNGTFPMETIITASPDQEAKEKSGLPVLLAVDDDPEIVRYLEALFLRDYQVLPAHSAEEALLLAQDHTPDVVLSDVAMPGKDGFSLCRELKSNLQLSHIPVILVTAMGTIQNQVQGLDLGADAYVTKPFDPSYLKALVRSQLENRRRIQIQLNSATESSEVDTLSSRDRSFLDQLYALMEKELSNEDLDMGQLTKQMKISRTKFYYKIKSLTGKTPGEFFMQYKLNIAAKLLRKGELNISEIAFRTGFKSLPHFSRAFKKKFGVSPSKYSG